MAFVVEFEQQQMQINTGVILVFVNYVAQQNEQQKWHEKARPDRATERAS